MKILSATDLAIALADRNGTLNIREFFSERFNETYAVIEDEHGLIETALTLDEAKARVDSVKAAAL